MTTATFILGNHRARRLRPFLSRPFSESSRRKLLIVFERGRISEAQIYPFAEYADAIGATYAAQIRFLDNARLIDGVPRGLQSATHVIFQSWLTDPAERLDSILAALRRDLPDARLTYFDCFANNDLRFARKLDQHIATYAKKSLFRDRSAFLVPTLGHTNLVDHYSRLYGLEDERVDWQVPPTILDKLHLTPNFFTGPQFLGPFRDGPAPSLDQPRSIDIHARLAVQGTPWYTAMRGAFVTALGAIEGLAVQSGASVGWGTYMAELRASKICASPFGYGELCWRDIEAFLTGAVLLKPDMGHLETLPDLYRPGETYIPIAWDFLDMEERIRQLLADEALRRRIADNAFRAVRDYLAQSRFVDDMAFVFEDQVKSTHASPVNTSLNVPTS